MRASAHLKVLICGCGIAGPTLAFWLERAGFVPTVLESAPAPRRGGYMIDFWGSGFEVASRMGLAPLLREIGYDVKEMRMLDAQGRPSIRVNMGRIAEALAGHYCSLQRGELADALRGAIRDRVEIQYGDTIRSMESQAEGVRVRLESGRTCDFDLVVGADGVHSRVRRLAFGPRSDYEVRLGYRVGAFTATDYPLRTPDVYVSRTSVGWQLGRFLLRDGRTVFFMFVAGDATNEKEALTTDEQKRELSRIFARQDDEREVRCALQALERADDLYFDSVTQVRMPGWSRGRVALVGDAAYAPSLLAGEGASMAMTGAYILAGELSKTRHAAAFSAYESVLRAFTLRRQQSVRYYGGWFAPRSRVGLWLRNGLTRLASMPLLTGPLVGAMVKDRLEMPDFHWLNAPRLQVVKRQ